MDFDVQAADGFPWDKVDAAKRYLYAVKPWWARFGEKLKIVPVYQPPIGNAPYGATTSTDRQFRLYIDRGYALAKPIHILAGAIEHEFQHHTRDTFNRLRHLSDEEWAEFANIAFNLEINGGMDAEQRSLEMDQVRIMCQKSAVFSAREMELWGVTAPPGLEDEGWVPRIIPLPDGLSAEEYFTILKKSKEEQEKREREEREREEQEKKEQEEQERQEDSDDESDTPQQDDSAGDGSEAEGEDSSDKQEGDESEDGGNYEGADSDASEEGADSEGDPEAGESGGDDDSEDSQSGQGSSTSDRKDEGDPDDDADVNDASNGAEDLSDGGESDGSEDSAPDDDADANESNAKDSGSAGGNHSSQEKGNKKSDSKGDNGNASIAETQDTSGQEGGEQSEAGEEASQEGEGGKETQAEIGLETEVDTPDDDRVIPTAEIADKVDALKEKLDHRLWSKEMENPTDELTASPWKPEERENEKPVDRTEIAEAMQLLEQDVTEASLNKNFGLKPGKQIVNWVFRQQKVRGVDWQSKLVKLVSSAYTSAKVSGASDLSYTVRNPNQPEFGAILQGLHDYAPKIKVIQDVSGSMRTGKRQSLAMSAFTDLCTKVLGNFNSKVEWITVDADIIDIGQASGWSKALQRRMSYGFGGTKIGPIIDRCMKGELKWKGKKYDRPDLLIIVTDCAFDWPEKRPTKRGKILVVSVDSNMSNVNFFLPRWLDRKRELVIIR